MDNSISFKGAFLIKHPTPEYKNAIKSALGKKKHIFENLNNKGDVLYVVRNSADKDVANFICENPDTKFSYFPGLSTKSGFDTNKSSDAMQKLKDYKGLVISNINKLMARIKKTFSLTKSNIWITQNKNLKLMQKETLLNFNDKDFKRHVDAQTGVCTVKALKKDNNTGKISEHKILTITPPGKYGVCYAKYTPLSSKEAPRRIAIKNGEKIFEYISSDSEAIADKNKNSVDELFNTNVKDAKEYYKNQMAKRKSQNQ